jgi:outer membrane protein assembly factor BamB
VKFPKRIFLLTFVFVTLLFALSSRAQGPSGMADTPWPMYQHDPQHTGRSPFLGPTHKPELLWTVQLPQGCGESGGMSIARDGSLLLSLHGLLHRFDPVTRELQWTFPYGDNSRCVPLVGADGNIYWGFGMVFVQVSPGGEAIWSAELDPNFVFGSSPTFGPEGNLYFVHDGLWSFTPSGEFRWFNPFTWFAHAAPAVGPDGTIYASSAQSDLCAYHPTGTTTWCLDTLYEVFDRTPAVDSDGTIYLPTDENTLQAITPDGSVLWNFWPDERRDAFIPEGLAITSDHSIYFALTALTESSDYLYAVDAEGQRKWKVSLPANPLTGLTHLFDSVLADRAGNAFICSCNSRCYGIGSDGSTLWELELPLIDSIIVVADVQPLIAADGLLYVVDNYDCLYAFADPTLYPALTTTVNDVTFQVEPGTPSFTTTLPISSTVSPITFTVSMTPTEWVSVTQAIGVSPSTLTLQFNSASLAPGIYRTDLRVMPLNLAGKWLRIPITLNVGMKQIFLPLAFRNHSTYRILYSSMWFQDHQFAFIEQTGGNRTAVAHNLPNLIDSHRMVYSPDGRKVALNAYYEDGDCQIIVLDTMTGQNLLEISSSGRDMWPTWSPNSDRVAFWSTRDDNSEIYVINLDGTGLRRLTYNHLTASNLFWSPAGDKIAFQRFPARTYIMNADGSDSHDLFPNGIRDRPAGWSPDGRYLLTRSRPDISVMDELRVYDFETGSYTKLADVVSDDPVAWSPDGTRIAYVAGDYRNQDIFLVNADGSGVMNLTNSPGTCDTEPAWTPDSRWIAFTSGKCQVSDYDPNPNLNLFVVRPDGTGLRQITTNIGRDSNPFWRP